MIIKMLIIIMCIFPTTVFAQLRQQPEVACNLGELSYPHNVAVAKLKLIGEVSVAIGISLNGKAVTEVFINHETKTWSIIVTGTDGKTCMKASGREWYFKRGLIPGLDVTY